MVRLGVNYSPTLMALLRSQPLDIDYIKVDADRGLEAMRIALEHRPVLLHDLPDPFWLNYENPFQDEQMQPSRVLLDTAQPPWLSTGIGASAEPQGHRGSPYREADPSALQTRDRVLSNIVRHGRRLREWATVPLLLENFNYHPTNAYEYICEPEVIHYILDEIGCGLLLDLGHSQICAHNMGWPSAEAYLSSLPLREVGEVHLSHPVTKGGQMYDMHQPAEARDLSLLAWVLARTPTEAVSLEIEDVDEATLLHQIVALRRLLS